MSLALRRKVLSEPPISVRKKWNSYEFSASINQTILYTFICMIKKRQPNFNLVEVGSDKFRYYSTYHLKRTLFPELTLLGWTSLLDMYYRLMTKVELSYWMEPEIWQTYAFRSVIRPLTFADPLHLHEETLDTWVIQVAPKMEVDVSSDAESRLLDEIELWFLQTKAISTHEQPLIGDPMKDLEDYMYAWERSMTLEDYSKWRHECFFSPLS